MSNDNKGDGLFYFLAGTAVGAALGVLFAPRAGRETREDIGEWLKERREQGSELLHKVKGAYREPASKHHDGVAA